MAEIHDENDRLLDMVHPTESHDTSKLNFLFLSTKYNKTSRIFKNYIDIFKALLLENWHT